MSMYYLHREGTTTGPFAPGRLRQMWTAGEVGPGDLVCEHGTEEWMDAEAIAMPMQEDLEVAAPRPPRRNEVRRFFRRPYGVLAIVVIVIGFGALFSPAFPLGILVVLIGLALGRERWFCGGCGNRIERTSAMCPACRAPLAKWTIGDWAAQSKWALIFLGTMLLAAIAFFVFTRIA